MIQIYKFNRQLVSQKKFLNCVAFMQHLGFGLSKIAKNLLISAIVITISLATISCSKEKETNEQIIKKKRIEPNIDERMKSIRDQGGGIFNTSRGNKNNNTFEFSTSNVLWRASLDSLKSIPLSNVDYSGGIILTDWYSNDLNSKESIKIKIQFRSNDLSISSLDVTSHKKICENNNCIISMLDSQFNTKIKNTIIQKAKELEIKRENEKNKK
jgi:hypothetical protein